MKEIKVGVLSGIVLLIIAGFIARYKIFEDKIELKYILSEKITSDLSDKSEEAIQQLTIRNSGDVIINSIIVKINSEIYKYQIQKFKFTDSVAVSLSKTKLEITYPELPPEGEIIIILKSINSAIDKDKVKIFHSKGKAKEAFSNNESNGTILFISIFLIYLLFIIYGIRFMLIDSYESAIDYSPYDKILKHKNPWYISYNKWDEIRKKAIKKLFDREHERIIEKCSFYQFLDSDKKVFLTDEEWNLVIDKAEEAFIINLSKKLYQYSFIIGYEEIINLRKPKNIRIATWNIILEQISKAICFHKLMRVLNYENESTLLELLNSEKPEIVFDKDWNDLINIVIKVYSALIIDRGINHYDPDKYLKNNKLDILEESKRSVIIKIFETIHESERLKNYYTELLNTITSVIFWNEEPVKPNNTTEDDWNKIIQIFDKNAKIQEEAENKLMEAEDKLMEAEDKLIKASSIEKEAMPLLNTVTKQLDVIDRILREPETITKIEDYNVPFQKGNWENLKRVAENLKNIK